MGAMAGALISAGYYLSIMFSQLFVGRPSSTWVIGFVWIPILVLKPAFIGLLIGITAWIILRPLYSVRLLSATEVRIIKWILILLIFASAAAGVIKISKESAQYAPRIVYTSGEIEKINKVPFESYEATDATLTWESSVKERQPGGSISWNGENIDIHSVDEYIIISDPNQILKRMKVSLDEIRYISKVYAITAKFDRNTPEHLAVLAQVRAIRDCYILLILDSQKELSFQEILKRSNKTAIPLKRITNMADGQEVLIVDGEPLNIYKKNSKVSLLTLDVR